MASILAFLAAITRLSPWLEKLGDVLYSEWKKAQALREEAAVQKYLDKVRQRSEDDAAKVERFMADAAKARSEKADAPPPPSPTSKP